MRLLATIVVAGSAACDAPPSEWPERASRRVARWLSVGEVRTAGESPAVLPGAIPPTRVSSDAGPGGSARDGAAPCDSCTGPSAASDAAPDRGD
jgi:hypothetical protein